MKKTNFSKKIIIFLMFLLFSNNISYSEAIEKETTLSEKVLKFFYDDSYKSDVNFQRHRLEFETGAAHALYNKIGQNNTTGSLFNTTDLNSSLNFYFRIAYYFNLDKKNSFRILIAPFKYSGTGSLSGNFSVNGQDFQNGTSSFNYQFNSYRFTYRHEVFGNKYISLKLGLTLKIRDARFNINQGNSNFSQSDVGFVPLGHFSLEIRPVENFYIVLEADAAGAPQGRAIDFASSLRYDINKNLDISLGYRFLEGGAFNKNAYNIAFFNYYFFSIGFKI